MKYFPAAVSHYCLCATGLTSRSNGYSVLTGRKAGIYVDYNGHPEYYLDHSWSGGQGQYSFDYSTGNATVEYNDKGTRGVVTYTAGALNVTYKTFLIGLEDCGKPPGCTKYNVDGNYALEWKGKDPKKKYTVYTG